MFDKFVTLEQAIMELCEDTHERQRALTNLNNAKEWVLRCKFVSEVKSEGTPLFEVMNRTDLSSYEIAMDNIDSAIQASMGVSEFELHYPVTDESGNVSLEPVETVEDLEHIGISTKVNYELTEKGKEVLADYEAEHGKINLDDDYDDRLYDGDIDDVEAEYVEEDFIG